MDRTGVRERGAVELERALNRTRERVGTGQIQYVQAAHKVLAALQKQQQSICTLQTGSTEPALYLPQINTIPERVNNEPQG